MTVRSLNSVKIEVPGSGDALSCGLDPPSGDVEQAVGQLRSCVLGGGPNEKGPTKSGLFGIE